MAERDEAALGEPILLVEPFDHLEIRGARQIDRSCIPFLKFRLEREEMFRLHARRLWFPKIRSSLTSTTEAMPVPGAQTKAPRKWGAPKIQPGRASGSGLGRLELQELAGICDRDRPRLHRLRNLAHEVDV